jgi:hypothetical protein
MDAVLADPRTAAKHAQPIQQCRLPEIQRHVLRVEGSRCARAAVHFDLCLL